MTAQKNVRPGAPRVSQLRIVIRVPDVAALLRLFQEELGLELVARFGADGADAVLLDAGTATIEIGNQKHADEIDELEVGRRASPQFRLALEVDDTDAITASLAAHPGVDVLGPPVLTPWNSLNSRLTVAEGVQMTLFESRDDEERFV
jgi:catechol 2,3-dioxygenase-like lactoylglutathione lyase family enzyme